MAAIVYVMCLQVLLHYENFKIPENLARFAVKHGMSGFVKKMSAAVPEFVANRRLRVDKVCSVLHLGQPSPCYACRPHLRPNVFAQIATLTGVEAALLLLCIAQRDLTRMPAYFVRFAAPAWLCSF